MKPEILDALLNHVTSHNKPKLFVTLDSLFPDMWETNKDLYTYCLDEIKKLDYLGRREIYLNACNDLYTGVSEMFLEKGEYV